MQPKEAIELVKTLVGQVQMTGVDHDKMNEAIKVLHDAAGVVEDVTETDTPESATTTSTETPEA
jgi:hypothetical protein